VRAHTRNQPEEPVREDRALPANVVRCGFGSSGQGRLETQGCAR
jgi:hypothetical protein